MKATIRTISTGLVFLWFSVATLSAQAPGTEQEQPEFIKQGQQLMREGKLDAALALYRQTLQTSQDSLPANMAAGSVLDLMGQGEEARQYFAKAIQVADTPEHKAMAQRAMAMSYAFEGNCKKTIQHEQAVFNYYGSVKDFFRQGEIADEAARVCIDSGDLDSAYEWYKTGHETGLKEPDIKPARKDLWEFRWEHAQARIAARRGNQAEAQKHVAAAKTILDKGTNPEQAQFLPYLEGYVAFYAGRLQGGARRFAEGEPERLLHSMHDWTDLRKVGRQGESLGVLPQGFNSNRAQSRRRVRCTVSKEEARLASELEFCRAAFAPGIADVVFPHGNRCQAP